MREMNDAHVSTWMYGLTAFSELGHDMGPTATTHLSSLMDLPPAYEGIRMQSLERAADEELLGSFASISASLIPF
jgi:hypothetical protein